MSAMATTTMQKPTAWVPSDWNAFFGFRHQHSVNMLVLTGLSALRAEDAGLGWCSAASCPRFGLMMCLSTLALRVS